MPKLEECPECGSTDLNDCWQRGRKLRQGCNECEWRGEERIPEKEWIETTKKAYVDQFCGHNYEIYDQYGHIMVSSRSYPTRAKAKAAALAEKKRTEAREDAPELPITILLWPAHVTVKAERL